MQTDTIATNRVNRFTEPRLAAAGDALATMEEG
jgi:hypothetical protein